jgi:hypothetical protein
MTERLSGLELYQTHLWRMSERGTRVTSRRKTGDKGLGRSWHEGVSGLQAQSRAPLSGPHRRAADVAAVLLEAMPRQPAWGSRTILP